MLDAAEPFARGLLRKGAWIYALTALTAPLEYVIRIVTARSLDVADFGLMYGVMMVVTLVWSYNDLGFCDGLNYFLPKRVVAKDWAGATRLAVYAFVVQLSTSLLLGAVIWWAADPIGTWLFHTPAAAPVLRIYVLYLLAHGLFQVPVALFNALQDVKAAKGVECLRIASTLAFAVWVGWGGDGTVLGFTWAWIAGAAVAVAAGWGLAAWRLRAYFDRRGFSWVPGDFFPVLKYSAWSMLAVNVGTVLTQLDTLFVVYLLGVAANGAYSNYLSLMSVPTLVAGPALLFLFPVFSELFARGDGRRIRELKRVAYRHFSALGLYFGSFYLAFGPLLADVFFGPQFEDSGRLMAWSAPFLAFSFLMQLNFMLLAGTGRARVRTVILLAGLVLNVLAIPALLSGVPFLGWPGFGLPGAALATGLAWALMFFLSVRSVRSYAAPFDWAPLAKNVAAAAALAWAGHAWLSASVPSGFSGMAVALAAGLAVHILAWSLLNLRAALADVRSARLAGPATP